MNNDIDIVMTYVDNQDPIWISAIKQYNAEISEKRFRSWDNLQYLFRGIDRYMKFVRNVYLVVSNIEQVPDWVDQNEVKIILHKDIIPGKYLPTFNSTTIEMFLCFIPGLSEKFIYFNDDMFPNAEMSEFDFFRDGKPVYQLINRIEARRTFRWQCQNSYKLALEISGKKDPNSSHYFYIKHSADPMVKSKSFELWKKAKDRIEWSISKFREPFNYTQYLFPDYCIMTNFWIQDNFDFKYYTTKDICGIENDIMQSMHKIICINDSKNIDFNAVKTKILELFQIKFPEKCRFEK